MPNKPTLHFVYATPHTLIDKITLRFLKRKLFHPDWEDYAWPTPVRAPLSITYQIAAHFSDRYRIKLYDLEERFSIQPATGDILLGHIWPDKESPFWRALDNPKFAKKYLITPYNHDARQILWTKGAVQKCDKFFAICGDYWMETFDKSPIAEFADKIIHLNMAIDSTAYPLLKKEFNPPGKRKFFYIGRHGYFGDEKGIRLLEDLAEKIPDFSGGYICHGGEIKGWNKISLPTKLTPKFMAKIAEEYDCFINMSRADAQATTVLEAMSWGFPIACTKETGYTDRSNFLLHLDNLEQNIQTIQAIQNIDENELRERVEVNRKKVDTKYSWQRFLSILEEGVEGT